MARIPRLLVSAVAIICFLLDVGHAVAGAMGSTPPSFLFILGDDIGWADFSYSNGTAITPRIKEWISSPGTVTFQDFHSAGTVCSPTRASVLTGRNHFRDCVNYVYDCSDPTECTPSMNFAPQRTFTVADAVRAAKLNYTSKFFGKWHLGSFYNDSEALGGITSSPLTHGFDEMEATIEVAPTATLNCECNAAWQPSCNYGHYGQMTHCTGTQGPDPNAQPGCCFNYWHGNTSAVHGVSNLTTPSPDDDSTYIAGAFVAFLESLGGRPFLAQLSFHNCHIPFVGTQQRVADCNATASTECAPPLPDAPPYTFAELDYYACLNELDASVGFVLDALVRLGYYNNTQTWLTTDNGPEVNCGPEGRCGSGSSGVIPPGTLHRPACDGPGSAGVLRGRKRDVWEGGHRVPGAVSWPAVVAGPARSSWSTVVSTDFLPTVMEVLGVQRPAAQLDWALDGVSILPILRGEAWPGSQRPKDVGWMFSEPVISAANGYALRSGRWKYVAGGVSCDAAKATFDCSRPQLYDMSTDWAEEHDLAQQQPALLAALAVNFSAWFASVRHSIEAESRCDAPPPPFPPHPAPSALCDFLADTALNGDDVIVGTVASAQECCGACRAYAGCVAGDYWAGTGACHLKRAFSPKPAPAGTNRTSVHVQAIQF